MSHHVMTLNINDNLYLHLKEQFANVDVSITTAMTMRDVANLCEVYRFQLIVIEYDEKKHTMDFLKAIRRTTFTPITIILDAFNTDLMCIFLDTGVDMCLVANWPPEYITANLLSQMRRYTRYNHLTVVSGRGKAPFYSGDIFIDPLRHIVQVRGKDVDLRPREFSLLLYFMQNPDIVLSTEQICENAWGNEGSYDRGITGPIALLRKAIEPDPANPLYIQTVRRVGYRFTAYKSETCDIYSDSRAIV